MDTPAAPKGAPYVLLKPLAGRTFAGNIVLLTPSQAKNAGDSVRPAEKLDLARFGRDPEDLTELVIKPEDKPAGAEPAGKPA